MNFVRISGVFPCAHKPITVGGIREKRYGNVLFVRVKWVSEPSFPILTGSKHSAGEIENAILLEQNVGFNLQLAYNSGG
jgi:hypothetical protein